MFWEDELVGQVINPWSTNLKHGLVVDNIIYVYIYIYIDNKKPKLKSTKTWIQCVPLKICSNSSDENKKPVEVDSFFHSAPISPLK